MGKLVADDIDILYDIDAATVDDVRDILGKPGTKT
jgi:hypothetical protein